MSVEPLYRALAELLRGGEHDGPCTNEGSEWDDPCERHMEMWAIRQQRARNALTTYDSFTAATSTAVQSDDSRSPGS